MHAHCRLPVSAKIATQGNNREAAEALHAAACCKEAHLVTLGSWTNHCVRCSLWRVKGRSHPLLCATGELLSFTLSPNCCSAYLANVMLISPNGALQQAVARHRLQKECILSAHFPFPFHPIFFAILLRFYFPWIKLESVNLFLCYLPVRAQSPPGSRLASYCLPPPWAHQRAKVRQNGGRRQQRALRAGAAAGAHLPRALAGLSETGQAIRRQAAVPAKGPDGADAGGEDVRLHRCQINSHTLAAAQRRRGWLESPAFLAALGCLPTPTTPSRRLVFLAADCINHTLHAG